MPYWITSTLAATPALLWMFAGVGLPWALLLLPRRDWRDPAIVGCLMLAFGPALLTAWMFILGTLGGAIATPYITLPNILVGTMVIAVLGWLLVWRKLRDSSDQPVQSAESKPSAISYQLSAKTHQPPITNHQSLFWDERLLIGLVLIALVIRWLGVAYWPSTAYDARWVYAYQGQLYALKGFIPPEIGYYPPFLALQHAWLHLAVGGVDDHAARAVLPWLHLGSILAAYTLGKLLFTRRVGLYLAAIWALYPHLGEWSRYGDLEVPVAFLFTAAAAFFLKVTSDQRPAIIQHQDDSEKLSTIDHRLSTIRYALIAGLLLGIGLWAKPTMGAFIWGVMLLVGLTLLWHLIARFRTSSSSPHHPITSSPSSSLVTRHSSLITSSSHHPITSSPSSSLVTRHSSLITSSPSPSSLVTRHSLLSIPLITALACLPLGAAWYLRNIALGHPAVDFPPAIWLDRAARSGVEFGWLLLTLGVGVAYLLWSRYRALNTEWQRTADIPRHESVLTPLSPPSAAMGEGLGVRVLSLPATGWVLAGTGLILLATLPTILQPARMGWLEWGAFALGVGLIGLALWRWLKGAEAAVRRDAWVLTMAGLLALPYFVTWFYSYSYHYRLSFAIVPLMILPTAVILAWWVEQIFTTEAQSSQRKHRVRSLLMGMGITLLAIPGILNPLYDSNAGWDWLWTDKLPDDHARHRSGNEALMAVVDGLQIYLDAHDRETQPLRVIAPGALQLPFFFPLEDIRTAPPPAQISDLQGATYYIYGVPESGGDFGTFIPGANPVLDLLGRAVEGEDDARTPLRRAWWADDGIFQYNIYELHLERRFTPIDPRNYAALPEDVTFGGVVRLLGYDVVGLAFWRDRPLWMHLYWQVLERSDRDLFTYVHLRDCEGNLIRAWDGPVSWRDDGFRWDAANYASSLSWEPGEYLVDRRIPRLQEPIPPLGEGYQVFIGLYDPLTNERLPVTVDGVPAGDGWRIPVDFSVTAEPG
jgi:hypothetical protein